MPPTDASAGLAALAPLLPTIGTALASAWVITRLNVRGLQRDTVTLLQTALAETRTEVAELRERLDQGQQALVQAQADLATARHALDQANAQLRVKDDQIASLQQRVLHLEQEAGIAPAGRLRSPPKEGA